MVPLGDTGLASSPTLHPHDLSLSVPAEATLRLPPATAAPGPREHLSGASTRPVLSRQGPSDRAHLLRSRCW